MKLNELDVFNKSLVIITSDHGEDLELLSMRGVGHSWSLSQSETMIPMILGCMDKPTLNIIDHATLIDIAPTIIGHIGCPIPEIWEGVDIVRDSLPSRFTYN